MQNGKDKKKNKKKKMQKYKKYREEIESHVVKEFSHAINVVKRQKMVSFMRRTEMVGDFAGNALTG